MMLPSEPAVIHLGDVVVPRAVVVELLEAEHTSPSLERHYVFDSLHAR